MTQVSVTPATTAAAPTASEAAPVLLQAGQRAEFSARLLAALSALRAGIPAAPAPTAAETPALPVDVELAAAPLEDTEQTEPLEEAPESEGEGEAVVPATDGVADFAPLALLQLSSDDTPEEPSGGGEGAPAQVAAEPPAERAADTAGPRPAGGTPQPLVLPQLAAAPAAAQQQPDASEPSSSAAEAALDATTASAAPARRAEKTGVEAPGAAPEPAPTPDAAVARGSELATPPAQSARSEAAAPAPGRVLPELPVRNEQEIVDQVRFLLNRRGGQASIELHPPQLGQVGLRISVTDHAVRLEITADRLPVAELLHKHLPQLQQALEAQGLQIDRAQVDLRERGGDGRERGDPGDAGARRRGHDSDGERTPRQPSYTRAALPAYSLGAVDVHA